MSSWITRHTGTTAAAIAVTVLMAALMSPRMRAAVRGVSPGLQAPGSTNLYQFKIGVLPFVDNTGSGGQDIGLVVGRAVQAELAHSTPLIGRVLKVDEGTNADAIDADKAVDMGRTANVDVVLVGSILEATSEESDKSVSPSIFGQTIGGHARSVKSVVTLQGDLYNVADGKQVDSIRVTGRASDTKVGADVSTDLGSISSDGSSIQNSPIGKALNNAVADLVKTIGADRGKMTRLPK